MENGVGADDDPVAGAHVGTAGPNAGSTGFRCDVTPSAKDGGDATGESIETVLFEQGLPIGVETVCGK